MATSESSTPINNRRMATSQNVFVVSGKSAAPSRHASIRGQRWAASAALSRSCLLGHLLEHSAQHPGLCHTLRERQPEAEALTLQIEALRVAADAAPVAIRRAAELGGVQPAGLGM